MFDIFRREDIETVKTYMQIFYVLRECAEGQHFSNIYSKHFTHLNVQMHRFLFGMNVPNFKQVRLVIVYCVNFVVR